MTETMTAGISAITTSRISVAVDVEVWMCGDGETRKFFICILNYFCSTLAASAAAFAAAALALMIPIT